MTTENFTDEIEIASLSPAEIAALTPDELAALSDDETPAVEPAPELDVELRQHIAPALVAPNTHDAEALLAGCAQFEQQAAQAFQDGEITATEYRAHLADIADYRDRARWQHHKAEIAHDMAKQAEDRAWFAEVDRFMRTTGAAIARSHSAKIAFDEHVKAVTADPANAHLSDRAQLEKAFKLYEADMAATFGGGLDVGRAVERQDAMDFSALDRLAESDPLALEAAVARMTPDQFEQYAQWDG